jgi:orotidine-5'-phosphate decarboxylase
MHLDQLVQHIRDKKSFLCVGLDTDPEKLPTPLARSKDVVAFNKEIIQSTHSHCIAYKINTAFYEAYGAQGWKWLEETVALIPNTHFIIADAKRGDIGNTSSMYARAFFQQLNCDAVTVAPYMGIDSVSPFLTYKNKWVILLALTSNQGARDFQLTEQASGAPLYERVMVTASRWASPNQLMFVVGATQASHLAKIRRKFPNHFFLVPGVGAQGGSLHDVVKNGISANVGLLVNASRSIIYASSGEDFASAAAAEAKKMHLEMESLLDKYDHLPPSA